jgi:Tfp pilus assembly protein PilV
VTEPPRSERGSTLIEVLISVVVLGLAITALLGGMTTTTGSSSLARQQADVEATLTSVGAAVTDPNSYPYQCVTAPGVYTLQPGLPQLPAGWSAANVTVAITGYWSTSGASQPACGPAMVQQLTVTVTSPTGGVTMSRDFVKGPSA